MPNKMAAPGLSVPHCIDDIQSLVLYLESCLNSGFVVAFFRAQPMKKLSTFLGFDM